MITKEDRECYQKVADVVKPWLPLADALRYDVQRIENGEKYAVVMLDLGIVRSFIKWQFDELLDAADLDTVNSPEIIAKLRELLAIKKRGEALRYYYLSDPEN
ncbi:hypothetical protein [Escherichia coli]|uniref:hypothetical protein n=1 Tax=Escherichia coli TaxID=562 RepID=UPI001ADC3D4A|nr:hypothetical protein [Escherichia coli]MBO9236538.1 hypothetical protein [Escherichia coli]